LWWYTIEPLVDISLEITVGKDILNGSNGLFVLQNVGLFFADIASQNWTLIEEKWGASETDIAKFLPYFFALADTGSYYQLEDIFAAGGGLFTFKTVDEWLWGFKDPLVALVQPDQAVTYFNLNFTSEEDCYRRSKSNTYNTGYSDVTQIMQYINWQGETEIKVFPEPYPVKGSSEDGQFHPFLEPYTLLSTWNDPYLRNIPLVPKASIEVHGVHLQRYEIDNSTWVLNPSMNQYAEGFANLTAVKHSPIFMGSPHFFLAEDKWRSKIEGMKNSSWTNDATKVDVEPWTGKVLQVHKSLQVNVYLENSAAIAYFDPYVPAGIMYPILWAFERVTVTEELAGQITAQLYTMLTLEDLLLPVFVPVGGLFVLLGLFVAVVIGHVGCRLHKEEKAASMYSRINTEE